MLISTFLLIHLIHSIHLITEQLVDESLSCLSHCCKCCLSEPLLSMLVTTCQYMAFQTQEHEDLFLCLIFTQSQMNDQKTVLINGFGGVNVLANSTLCWSAAQELIHWFCSRILRLSSGIAFGSDCQMTSRGLNLDSILHSAAWPTGCKGFIF